MFAAGKASLLHIVSLCVRVSAIRGRGKIPAAHKASKPTICLSWTHKCYLYIQRKHHSLIISSSIRNLPLISSAESLSLLLISAQRLSHPLICLPQVYAHKVSHWKLIWTAWISLSIMPLQMVYSSMWLQQHRFFFPFFFFTVASSKHAAFVFCFFFFNAT